MGRLLGDGHPIHFLYTVSHPFPRFTPDSMPKPTLDYSLYLVTGRELLPPGKVSLRPQILAIFAKLLTCYSIHRTTTKVLKK